MPLVDYTLDEVGRMTVRNDTATWYRYIDMTPQAEALFRFIERAIDTELADELAFLKNYDEVKSSIREVVDMPDRQIDLCESKLISVPRGSSFNILHRQCQDILRIRESRFIQFT